MHLSDDANNLLQQWKHEIDNLRPWGEGVYSESLRSYTDMLVEVVSLGGEIYADGNSLIASNDFIVYGVILRKKGNGVLEFTIHS